MSAPLLSPDSALSLMLAAILETYDLEEDEMGEDEDPLLRSFMEDIERRWGKDAPPPPPSPDCPDCGWENHAGPCWSDELDEDEQRALDAETEADRRYHEQAEREI